LTPNGLILQQILKMKKIALIFMVLLVGKSAFSQREIPFTQEDRDRLIRTEIKLEELIKRSEIQYQSIQTQCESIDKRFEGVDKQFEGVDKRFETIENQINDVKTFLYWGFGILFSFMAFLMGFIIWDRRTTLAPVKKEVEQLNLEDKKIKDSLIEFSQHQPKLREILKKAGVL